MGRILVIGAAGQLGTELTRYLTDHYGADQIVASDLNNQAISKFDFCRFEVLDVMDFKKLKDLITDARITQIYHLAAVLSASAEKNPLFSWNLNMQSLLHVLEIAKNKRSSKIYWPSSIAVFGPDTPKRNTPQYTKMNPNTIYGISKLAGERWCEYYFKNYNVDVRSLRYPGLIGYKSLPGGGTTDYAVDIYHKAIQNEKFNCFLRRNSYLPMMYMADAVKATINLMHAPGENIKVRSSYNVSGMNFSPEEIYNSIKKHIPGFQIAYQPDFRQKIADSWPNNINDDEAKRDWGWAPSYDLDKMTKDMLHYLPKLLNKEPVDIH
jgi:nucleoside-diphosphate-sugar epimerase